jgi:hypothetical protein
MVNFDGLATSLATVAVGSARTLAPVHHAKASVSTLGLRADYGMMLKRQDIWVPRNSCDHQCYSILAGV